MRLWPNTREPLKLELPKNILEIVQRQYAQVQATYDHVKKLRELLETESRPSG